MYYLIGQKVNLWFLRLWLSCEKLLYITVNNVPLKNTNKAVHLGRSLSTDDDDDSIVTAAIAQFWRYSNIFYADFGHILPYLHCKLFKQYCCSCYGAPLWLLSSHIVNKHCTGWRKAIWKMWRLSHMTHCDVITLISDYIPLEVSLQLRFCKFSSNILKYGWNVVKTVAKVALRNPFSTYCNNVLEITD